MKTVQERFDEKWIGEPNSGCWLWTASVRRGGYGQFVMDGSRAGRRTVECAHRASWQLHRGEIPSGLFVLHKCDMPCCVNPDHLFLGTHTDNMRDAINKERFPDGFNRRQRSLKLSVDEVIAIRASSKSTHSLAREFGVTQPHISYIRTGKKWKKLGGDNVRQ